jgi:nucleoside-diphosphate-sugar epimerase
MKCLVIGGGGFIGLRVVELLCNLRYEVRVLSRQRHLLAERAGASSFQGDVRDGAAVCAAMQGVDTAFHVAARLGAWGPHEAFYGVNVEGTRSVLAAARRSGLQRLVYTGSPSVVGYAHDVANGGSDLPYASRHECAYAHTKAEAERLVLAANGSGLATVVLRPHLVIGPRDPATLPRFVERAARGRMRIVGDGRNLVDLTYVDNAAWAHLDAAAALARSDAVCAGRAYFISNGEPVEIWPWLNALLAELDIAPVRSRIPLPIARAAGAVLEAGWNAFSLPGEPPITRFLASALARSHWYDMAPAARDLGYVPRISLDEGRRRTVEALRGQLANQRAGD